MNAAYKTHSRNSKDVSDFVTKYIFLIKFQNKLVFKSDFYYWLFDYIAAMVENNKNQTKNNTFFKTIVLNSDFAYVYLIYHTILDTHKKKLR